jgi:hypothetical protein
MILKYSEIKPQLKTGDIFLFHSQYWLSDLIMQITSTVYSHVGMVVSNYPGVNDVCFLEATTENVLPCQAGTPNDKKNPYHPGSHLVLLDDLLKYYAPYTNGNFIARRLHTEFTPDMLQALFGFIQQVDARPFGSYFGMLVHWLEGQVSPISATTSTLFCAELVSMAFQNIGLLPMDPPANAYSPGTFSMNNKNLVMLSGASFSEEILVKWDGPVAG